jgi:SAM-dependent methyltransferase
MPVPIIVRPQLHWPQFPDFPAEYYIPARLQDPLRARNASFDWSVFTPEGLIEAEAYWDKATAVLASLLPPRYAAARADIHGVNVGTFTGAYQKAWMRRGYSMFGVEKEDVVYDLRGYGCDGNRDDAFELSSLADARFDFAILDRVYCRKAFYERFELNTRRSPRSYFTNIRRVLKPEGVLIGVLYDWYSKTVVSELAAMGELTLWPMKSYCLAFQVDLAREPSQIPDPMHARAEDRRKERHFSVNSWAAEKCKDTSPIERPPLIDYLPRVWDTRFELRKCTHRKDSARSSRWRG